MAIKSKAKKLVKKVNIEYSNIAKKKKIGKMVTISIADMFYLQYKNQRLCRYDMIVRYLAIENYYGKNDFGFDLYAKMQDTRKSAGYSEKAVDVFKKLIQSYEEHGYDTDSYIVADSSLNLFDGSHRMAMGLYHGIKNVSLLIMSSKCSMDYSIDWFFKNGFTNEEIEHILDAEERIKKALQVTLSCVVWAPAARFADAIVKDMAYFGEVKGVSRYSFDKKNDYNALVKKLYAIDDIEDWKIEKKLEHMKAYEGELISIDLAVDMPEFRVKKKTNLPISRQAERIKSIIRTRYKEQIEDYYYDIILHIADNYMQSEYMKQLFEEQASRKVQ